MFVQPTLTQFCVVRLKNLGSAGLVWVRRVAERFRWGILAHPLNGARDAQIDAALEQRGIGREDLFRPSKAVTPHRKRLACMLAVFRIDVGRAVAEHWQELKAADGHCRDCRESSRCNRWLEWAWTTEFDSAPMVFCPNAQLWSAIAQEQAEFSGP